MELEFFIDPAVALRCKHVVERMNKLRLPVLEISAADAKKMNGHSVALVPTSETTHRVGRHTHTKEVYVRYVGAPNGIRGPAAACSGVIEVSSWDAGRIDKAEQKARTSILASQLVIAIDNARIELARRAKEKEKQGNAPRCT